jgi:hypothetical protein
MLKKTSQKLHYSQIKNNIQKPSGDKPKQLHQPHLYTKASTRLTLKKVFSRILKENPQKN